MVVHIIAVRRRATLGPRCFARKRQMPANILNVRRGRRSNLPKREKKALKSGCGFSHGFLTLTSLAHAALLLSCFALRVNLARNGDSLHLPAGIAQFGGLWYPQRACARDPVKERIGRGRRRGKGGTMRAIIIGAGNAGRLLTDRLCREQHDVVVVDRRREPLQALEAQYDILAVRGVGANPRVLKEAGVSQADLLVSVTREDETNLLACACAKAAGAEFCVARLASPDYFSSDSPLRLDALGVDLAVMPKRECSRDIERLIQMSAAREVVPLLGGRIFVVGCTLPAGSPLLEGPLSSLAESELLQQTRIIAVRRDEKTSIPQGDTRLKAEDEVYIAARPDTVPDLFAWMGIQQTRIRKVLIGGGGDLGLDLAMSLEKSDLSTVLIEANEARAVHCSGALDRALVIQASIMDSEALEDAGLTSETAYIAATGDEENNIISCLLAKKAGAALTVAQISTPEYVPIIGRLNLLDRAVSSHLSLVNAILRFIRGRNVRATSLLQTLRGEMIEMELRGDSSWVGKKVRELRVPREALIVAVRHGDEARVPTGDTELAAGDRLVLYAMGSSARKLKSILRF